MTDIGVVKRLNEVTHGVVVVDTTTDEILEFVGFWSEPTTETLAALIIELRTAIGDRPIELYRATPAMIQHFTTSFDE
jgi:hypothetical protein